MNRFAGVLTAAVFGAMAGATAHAQEIACTQSSGQLPKDQLEVCSNFNWRMKELGADKLFHERFPRHMVFIQSYAPNLKNSRLVAAGFLLVLDSSVVYKWSTMSLADSTGSS